MTESNPDSTGERVEAEPGNERLMSAVQLRRMWKPRRDSYAAAHLYEDVRIRIHRCLTWLEAADMRGPAEIDTRLVEQWIALNALYGRWNPDRREPVPDRLSVETFIRLIRTHDADKVLGVMLREHKGLAMAIFGDRYLLRHFWESDGGAQPSTARLVATAQEWFRADRQAIILDKVLDRIYFVRCQVMHGGATYGGRLNRNAVKRTSMMLGHIVPTCLQIMMDHGYTDDWGELCYPPLTGSTS
ncbi:MAG: hypothetical protein EXS00_04820 [Phycisphaerales bacterium]|nr:hypothetical protein [Phycisphaerales bacterium]